MFTHRLKSHVLHSKKGATLVDYGLIVGFIAAATVGAIVAIGPRIAGTLDNAASTIEDATNQIGDIADQPQVPDTPLSYAGAGAHVILDGATAMDLALPSGLTDGDLVLAAIYHRDVLTPPAGWTVETSQATANGTANSRLTILSHDHAAGDPSSVQFTQGAANRMSGQIVAFRGGLGVISNVVILKTAQDMPGAAIAADDTFVFGAHADTYAINTGPETYLFDAQWTQVSTPSAPDNRLAVGYIGPRNQGADVAQGTMTRTTVDDVDGVGITLQVR